MSHLERIAEQRIARALARGEFDRLEGAGRPLELEDDSHVPPELRLAYRVLKNAGFVPPEVVVRKEIAELEAWLAEQGSSADAAAWKRLALLRTKLSAARGRETSFQLEASYEQRLLARLGGRARPRPKP